MTQRCKNRVIKKEGRVSLADDKKRQYGRYAIAIVFKTRFEGIPDAEIKHCLWFFGGI
jgi:hypothetical protein